MSKIAVISDAHLFQTFVEKYDSVKDLEKVIEEIKTRVNPDMLFLAGDMFDYKKTETIYLRHYEGESYMIKIREIMEKFGKPVYAIKGNHDKEEILKGLEQTVENFHYVKNDAKNLGDFSVCFMDSFYETGGYGDNAVQGIESYLKQMIAKMKKWNNTSVLLCHETFAPYENAIPTSLVEIMKKNFDLVLNGHMHFWSPTTYNSKCIICLPSLLPSKIVKGKYSMEQYVWSAEISEFGRKELDSPFAYVVLDTESKKVEIHKFTPSNKIAQITLEVTGLSLEETRKRLRIILSEIDKRNDRNDLILLPELRGEISFSPLYLEDIKEDFPALHIESIRHQETVLKTSLESKVVPAPTLTIEQLYEKMRSEMPKMVEQIKAKGIEMDEKTLSTLLKVFLDEELILKSSSTPQIKARLRTVIEPTIEAIITSYKQRKPSNFEDNLGNLLKMVR
ncbi:MAG: metallophosphoesterase [Nitrososphaerales archaeon]